MTEPKKYVLSEADERRLQSLRLLDDDFMSMVFDNNIEATELILNVFLDRYDMKVIEVHAQREYKNVSGHSVKLDIFAVDSDGKHYDIEIQRQDKGAGERRARFNSSMLDSRMLKAGQDYGELADSYVIFITEHDVRGLGKPIYRFVRLDEDTHEALGDGSHIIYVNGAYRDDGSRIGRLMHDFRCERADEMHNSALSDKMNYFKHDEGGREYMCTIVEDLCRKAAREAAQEAAQETAHKKSIEFAIGMLREKLSHELIVKLTNLPISEIEALEAALTE